MFMFILRTQGVAIEMTYTSLSGEEFTRIYKISLSSFLLHRVLSSTQWASHIFSLLCVFVCFHFLHCYFSLYLSPCFLLFALNVCFPFLLRLFPSIPFPPPHPSSFLFVNFSPPFTLPFSIRQMSAVTPTHTSFISGIPLSLPLPLPLPLSRLQILRYCPCIWYSCTHLPQTI